MPPEERLGPLGVPIHLTDLRHPRAVMCGLELWAHDAADRAAASCGVCLAIADLRAPLEACVREHQLECGCSRPHHLVSWIAVTLAECAAASEGT